MTRPPPTPSTTAWDFVVDRDDLRRHVVRDAGRVDLHDGEVRLRVDAAALTANTFFAPTALRQLVSDWGGGPFARRFGDALQSFTARSHLWLSADRRVGRAAVVSAFEDVLDGAVAPNRFVVVDPAFS